jgi:hypothetical protein
VLDPYLPQTPDGIVAAHGMRFEQRATMKELEKP